MKSYTGHHACSNNGGYTFVLESAPFLSKWPTQQQIDNGEYPPFLGEGYYFWEYDQDQAKWWGKRFYDDKYFIIEATINTNEENFLDLVGDRQQVSHLMLIIFQLVRKGKIPKDLPIGALIEYLKRANRESPGLFPYLIIRAQDYKHLHMSKKLYFNGLGHFTYVDTRHMFCLLKKDDLILTDRKIVFSSVI